MCGFLEDLFDLILTSVEYVFIWSALMIGFKFDVNRSIEPNSENFQIKIPEINLEIHEKMPPEELDLMLLISTDEDLFQDIYDTLNVLFVKLQGLNVEVIECGFDEEIVLINKKLEYLLDSIEETEIEDIFAKTLTFEFMGMALYFGINVILSDPMELYRRLINIRTLNYKRQLEGLPSIPEDSELIEQINLEYLMRMAELGHIPVINEFDTETNDTQMISKARKFAPEYIYDEYGIPLSYYDLSEDEDFDEDFEHFLISSCHEE